MAFQKFRIGTSASMTSADDIEVAADGGQTTYESIGVVREMWDGTLREDVFGYRVRYKLSCPYLTDAKRTALEVLRRRGSTLWLQDERAGSTYQIRFVGPLTFQMMGSGVLDAGTARPFFYTAQFEVQAVGPVGVL